ncbi:MAG: MFS transporter [Ruminococcaceae bacterium]|nr:MFS transporter [Oscillospiraceae bacterium]MBE6817281.1 MFS transporter [Oscillospiraceae bacterium]
MNFNISIDWKFITALGVAIGIDIFAIKMNTETATEVLINAIGTCKEFLVTEKCAN